MLNISITMLIAIVGYLFIIWAYDWGQSLFDGDDSQYIYINGDRAFVQFEIPQEATGIEISHILRENGLINNEWIFYIQARLNGSYRHFRRGQEFNIPLGSSENSIMQLLQEIQHIPSNDLSITIIEGRNNFQIADIAANLGYFTAEEFLYDLSNLSFPFSFSNYIREDNNFSGFLFPDTYLLPQNPNPSDIIIRMLNRFEEIFTPQMYARLQFDLPYEIGFDISLEELIIVASIIELEAIYPSDRPLMAAYIYNRLRLGMPLEIVSSLSYILNRRPDMLVASDFNINSPYNTFNRNGLPPGAISNPGISSILAALNPSNIDYIYKTISNRETMALHFSSNLADHQAAVLRYSENEEIYGTNN